MPKIKYILLDAANTLIHKPDLWLNMNKVFKEFGHDIELGVLKKAHKMTSEIVNFPDKTSADFYAGFNSKLLVALGIKTSIELLNALFKACSYLPWKAFDDIEALTKTERKLGILSNFNVSLESKLKEIIPFEFSDIIVSEKLGLRKPQLELYNHAIKVIKLQQNEILYVGDSMELDIVPANTVGLNSCLIDRENYYPKYKNRISSFNEINNYIKQLEKCLNKRN